MAAGGMLGARLAAWGTRGGRPALQQPTPHPPHPHVSPHRPGSTQRAGQAPRATRGNRRRSACSARRGPAREPRRTRATTLTGADPPGHHGDPALRAAHTRVPLARSLSFRSWGRDSPADSALTSPGPSPGGGRRVLPRAQARTPHGGQTPGAGPELLPSGLALCAPHARLAASALCLHPSLPSWFAVGSRFWEGDL